MREGKSPKSFFKYIFTEACAEIKRGVCKNETILS